MTNQQARGMPAMRFGPREAGSTFHAPDRLSHWREAMRELLAVMKALADENRLRIVASLDGRELCLCQLVELLGLATSTVSRHASILQQARLIRARKQGRWTYFRIDEDAPAVAADATRVVIRALQRDSQGRNDRRRLARILKMDPEELCRRQSACKC